TDDPAFRPKVELTAPKLADLSQLEDAEFRTFFSGSPIKRTGRDRFVRNTLIALGNSNDPSLLKIAEAMTDDASSLVSKVAQRAVKKLREA
ncbi:MAG: epoxyqueuosine reductase, partial [Rhodospirillales bacterium]